jgi:hypothetical protein
MREVMRFVGLLLTAVTLGLLAAIPLVATWRIPAGQCIAPVSLNSFKLGEEPAIKLGEEPAMSRVAGECAIAGSALKQPELIADPVWLDW